MVYKPREMDYFREKACLLETRKDFREAIPIRSKTEVN